MSAVDTIAERFAEMPRAIRWLLVTVLLVVGFQVWAATISVAAVDLKGQAESIESDIARVRAAEGWKINKMGEPVLSIGDVARPENERESREAMTEAVVQVMATHGIKKYDFKLEGAGQKLSRAVSRSIVKDDSKRVTRLSSNVKFECSHEEAIDIIADFERRAEIELISKLYLTKSDGSRRTVQVDLTLEVWMTTADGRRG